MTESERNKLAEEIIWVYNDRSKAIGAPIWVTEEVKEIARKAADYCAEAGVSPQMYVAAMEDNIPAHVKTASRNLFPYRMLATKSSVKWCREYAEKHKPDYDVSLKVQLNYLANAIARNKQTMEAVLMDRFIDFTPWFRTLISKEPVPEVLEEYGHMAALQLRDQSLLAFLKSKKFDIDRLCRFNCQQ